MATIYEIADLFVEEFAALNPLGSTGMGVAGHDGQMTDFSPDGMRAQYDFRKRILKELEESVAVNDRERIAKDCMMDDLQIAVDQYEAGQHLQGLNVLSSPLQAIRSCFDLMPKGTTEDWENIASRLHLVGEAIQSYRASLLLGIDTGFVAARRQAVECARQAEIWSGQEGAGSFFHDLISGYVTVPGKPASLLKVLEEGASEAANAYAEMAAFLKDQYAPVARDNDAVGKDRYALMSRGFNGIDLDLDQTYAWAWEQLHWVDEELVATAEVILPGGGIEGAKERLESDPSKIIEGEAAFKLWMQDLQDRTMEDLDGTHFDIPTPVKRIEALIAPPGGALAMYYTGPSEDFSRPGRTWYPTGGKTRFPIWGEVSIAYHEGVPGHHLQIATTKYLSDALSRYQRLLAGTSGYKEGWALYAERLMGELGYLSNPDYYFGLLRSQALRCVRVIVDIGMHLGLKIPIDQQFYPGEIWNPDIGLEFVLQRSHFPKAFVSSEVVRYLGMPGQAISYKVGERCWLDARSKAKEKLGSGFDLKAWHNRALNLGPMGLAQMQREMENI